MSDRRQVEHYINGKRGAATGGRSQEVLNPSTGKPQAIVPLASTAEVDEVISMAAVGQMEWAAMNPQ